MKKIITTIALSLSAMTAFQASANDVTCMALDCVKMPPIQVQQDIEDFHIKARKADMNFYLIDNESIKVEMPTKNLFNKPDELRSALKNEANDQIAVIYDFMAKYPDAVITFYASTDADLGDQAAIKLTKMQAKSVALNYQNRDRMNAVPEFIGRGKLDMEQCNDMNPDCNDFVYAIIENIWQPK